MCFSLFSNRHNYGQEPSILLQSTPSITTYSDAGSDWGYSYFRMRGVDQTRINMTLNGVPLNEPEDQGCYFSNYPGIFYAVDNVQIQRGSGMTKNGVSSFVGSIDLESIIPDSTGGSVNVGAGFYNSFSATIQLYNVTDNNKLYIQGSMFTSDGYKYRSGNNSCSAFITEQYEKNKNKITFVAFVGNQSNELAWIGSPMDSIRADSKHNGCSEYEVDHFAQAHTQFHYTRKLNERSKLKYTIYYNYLEGYYTFDLNNFLEIPGKGEIYKYEFSSNFIGNMLNYNYNSKRNVFNVNVGAHGYKYRRTHVGSEETLGYLYTNHGDRNEICN